ncbi:glucose-6-phosphate isomerase [Desulfonispora thiosulfatigenes DSM 11270]|uniref:Glucose-6-phosphate isomerase n=1 Tax=Desulfonispora thiosulfatigenes DSM 11270 TaxID=656914 RepID=A0A1W1VLZ1_DESTI|nr:glucose-6-phosphate isomerase [Desulfonispora thiosulfatigenes]SMB94336.1 glucose-6-phosphate isomerase [Desulfonispora thiosulfatigenes DSM 11270]
MEQSALWDRYKKYLYLNNTLGIYIDISRMNFSDNYFEEIKPKIETAFKDMESLEKGAIANPDEKRMVGHFWLRNPSLAPKPEIREEISETILKIKEFSSKIHKGEILSSTGKMFKRVLLVGIGGSALGPQFVANALQDNDTKLQISFLDNTDPDGFDRLFAKIKDELDQTIVLVISKSGGTKETSNGMEETKEIFSKTNLTFSKHFVAITGKYSKLHKLALQEDWLEIFPLWDFVGGRTSETSAVGLLPAALQGIDIDELLRGAKECDEQTRRNDICQNPAAILALMWYYFTQGVGGKEMVIIPYNDRLQLFSKYLQQLIMESLGKEKDLNDNIVNQGIAVYGNKGSTDQHSYVQQLLDGPDNYFITFMEVLKKRSKTSIILEDKVTSGDYLHAFLLGTRNALTKKQKQSITITVDEITPYSIGVLIALYERAVGLYASLVNINAYHQPSVESGKKIATLTINLQKDLLSFLDNNRGKKYTPLEIATEIGQNTEIETIFKTLQHLTANMNFNVEKDNHEDVFSTKYFIKAN